MIGDENCYFMEKEASYLLNGKKWLYLKYNFVCLFHELLYKFKLFTNQEFKLLVLSRTKMRDVLTDVRTLVKQNPHNDGEA